MALYNTTQYIDKEGDETGYIDNVLKIGKLRNRVIARNHMGQLWGKGKYSNTLFSISTEYYRRKFWMTINCGGLHRKYSCNIPI